METVQARARPKTYRLRQTLTLLCLMSVCNQGYANVGWCRKVYSTLTQWKEFRLRKSFQQFDTQSTYSPTELLKFPDILEAIGRPTIQKLDKAGVKIRFRKNVLGNNFVVGPDGPVIFIDQIFLANPSYAGRIITKVDHYLAARDFTKHVVAEASKSAQKLYGFTLSSDGIPLFTEPVQSHVGKIIANVQRKHRHIVKFTRMRGGFYEDGSISIDSDFLYPGREEELLEILLHETKHATRALRSGRIRGAAPRRPDAITANGHIRYEGKNLWFNPGYQKSFNLETNFSYRGGFSADEVEARLIFILQEQRGPILSQAAEFAQFQKSLLEQALKSGKATCPYKTFDKCFISLDDDAEIFIDLSRFKVKTKSAMLSTVHTILESRLKEVRRLEARIRAMQER